MMDLVLEMIWRQISGVSEMVRLIQTEAVLWSSPKKVGQQALSHRLTSLPSEMFLKVLLAILPIMQQRGGERERPLPPEIAWAQQHYTDVEALDGSTLDALTARWACSKTCRRTP